MTVALLLVAVAVNLYLAARRPGWAIAVAPLSSIALTVHFARQGSPLAACAAAGIWLASLALILLAREGPETRNWPQAAAKLLLGVFAAMVALAILVALRLSAVTFGVLLAVPLTGSILRFAVTSREALAADVLATIGASMRQNLPLAAALSSAAEGRTDNRSRVLRRIATGLEWGWPLSQAIQAALPRARGHAVALIRAAERIDQVPQAFAALEADLARQSRERRRVRPVRPWYPIFVLLLGYLIVSFMAVFIIPRFRSLFAEFGATLPASTRAVFGGARVATVFFGALAPLVPVALGLGIYVCFRPRRPDAPKLLSRLGDFVKWHLPVWRGLEREDSLLRTVEFLRLGLGAGCTIDAAIAGAIGLDVNGRFRRRLAKWLRRVQGGEDVSAAARAAGLGKALAWAFDRKTNPGNALAVLDVLEQHYRSRYSYKARLVTSVSWPCLTVALAGFVGFVVYAMFLPLAALIESAMVVPP